MANLTKEEQAALATVVAVGEAIKALGKVPSGHLYARLMGHMSLEMNHVLKLFVCLTAVLAWACETSDPSEGHVADCAGTYCVWDIGNREAGICCPTSAPYCGREGTSCPKGRCCASPGLASGLKPLDK
jgi:hypothetical protein